MTAQQIKSGTFSAYTIGQFFVGSIADPANGETFASIAADFTDRPVELGALMAAMQPLQGTTQESGRKYMGIRTGIMLLCNSYGVDSVNGSEALHLLSVPDLVKLFASEFD